jgi:thiol-disulfide isomerase/thioredoxin
MTTPRPKIPFSTLPFVLAALAGAIGIYWFESDGRKGGDIFAPVVQQNVANSSFSKALAKGPMAAFLVHGERKVIPAFAFGNDKGETLSLAQWKGKVVLLNLWATWCAPCRKEMPDIAALQKELAGHDFEVVALSVDRKGLEASTAFLKEIGAESLKLYIDPEAKSLAALQALGLPATVLIDRKGLEAGRLLGPAPWNSPEAKALVKSLLEEKV